MSIQKHFYLMLDTETAGGLDNPLVYDLGGAVVDRKGNVLERFSFVIYDVYVGMKDKMQSAYYAHKLPQYEQDLKAGRRKMVTLKTAFFYVRRLIKKYPIHAVVAHNARFDYNALNNTLRAVSDFKYFLPYGLPVWCTLTMAKQTIGQQKLYIHWCKENGYTYIDRFGVEQVRLTAEILYRYITHDNTFKEAHTGLEDVEIERVILHKILSQHKSIQRTYYKPRVAA